MEERNHIDVGVDREIIKRILLHICSDSNLEAEFAKAMQESTNSKVRFVDFSDWLATFDEENIK